MLKAAGEKQCITDEGFSVKLIADSPSDNGYQMLVGWYIQSAGKKMPSNNSVFSKTTFQIRRRNEDIPR